jgi:hypothetical protein
MSVMPFSSDPDVVQFAKAFLDNRVETFKKDIAICLTADRNKSHAYFPALITCIAFADLLSGLNAGTLTNQKLPELKAYVSKFIDTTQTVYTDDQLNVLYECFRHKVAHLAQPYAVFDTYTKRTFQGQPRRLITWTVHARGPRPPIQIVRVARTQIQRAPTPWDVFYDHRVTVSVSGLASDIAKSIPKYLQHLKTDSNARRRFRDCMPSYFPR